jgi:hypothetical protein
MIASRLRVFQLSLERNAAISDRPDILGPTVALLDADQPAYKRLPQDVLRFTPEGYSCAVTESLALPRLAGRAEAEVTRVPFVFGVTRIARLDSQFAKPLPIRAVQHSTLGIEDPPLVHALRNIAMLGPDVIGSSHGPRRSVPPPSHLGMRIRGTPSPLPPQRSQCERQQKPLARAPPCATLTAIPWTCSRPLPTGRANFRVQPSWRPFPRSLSPTIQTLPAAPT